MLNFTTTTIINDPCMADGETARIVVMPGLWKSDGTRGKKFVVRQNTELFVDDEHCPKLLKKTPYSAAKLACATVDLSACEENVLYRIAMYIRIQNNNSSFYANNWTFKGKPLYIEFKGGMTADEIVNLVKKYQLVQYGKDLVKVIADDEKTLTIKATDQWQKFMDQDFNDGVVLQELQTTMEDHCCRPDKDIWVNIDGAEVVERGTEAFGDFAHIVKDLRLPTGANLRWQGIAAGDVYGGEPNDDRPNPTGKYTQYTIQYDAERGILQQTALGGLGTSRTMHIFYVESGAVDAFEAALEEAGIEMKSVRGENNRVNFEPESADYSKDPDVELQAE